MWQHFGTLFLPKKSWLSNNFLGLKMEETSIIDNNQALEHLLGAQWLRMTMGRVEICSSLTLLYMFINKSQL